MTYSLNEISRIIHATPTDRENLSVSLLLTDSRSLSFPEETLFFALRTKQNDGHKYVEELYKKGVRCFVISRRLPVFDSLEKAQFLEVRDTLQALHQLTAYHRTRFQVPVIGITGSNGKTTVKEWLYQLLGSDMRIVRSPRSFNSQVGVPLSVWQMNEQSELAIFEAGISQPDEMVKLEKIILPQIGIFTNIGYAHQEGFLAMEQKCTEKLKLFLRSETLIYNFDDTLIRNSISIAITGANLLAWSFKNPNASLYITGVTKKEESTEISYIFKQTIKGQIEIPFVEYANVENAIHCLATLLQLGIHTDNIAQKMKQLHPVAMRLEVKEGINDCLIIDDTYNLDLNSLELALDFQMRRAKGSELTPTLILSDLQQTGKLPVTLYREVANLLKRKGIKRLIGIGANISQYASLFTVKKEFFGSTQEFLQSGIIHHFYRELILVKGAREFHFEHVSDKLQLKVHETILEVNLDAIVHNLNFYRNKLKPSTKMICMVKAFGYGAGSYELAKTLQEHHCDYLAVAVADEGAELRKAGIYMPVMVMNPEFGSFEVLFDNELEPEVYSFKLLKALIQSAENQGISHFPIHIKIDSGMHRLGFMPEDIESLCHLLNDQSALRVKSIFSHFSGSDSPKFDDFTKKQIACFTTCADQIEQALGYKPMRHILNSAGIERFSSAQMDMVRLGIGLYGVSATNEKGLRNVSTLKTTILQIKKIPAGETVGYSRKWELKRESKVGTIPIGYADGLNRHLGNGVGSVVVNGKKAPIIGNICMDLTMIDLTDIETHEGDTVIIFGEEQPVNELADKLETIPYEIITSVSSRVKRIYYRE